MIHYGDLFHVLPTLDAESIDACVTDPPYELGFMGKRWDASGVTNRPETWAAVYRVLKPGAHLLAFGGTRTFHRMTCAIEDAGFEIRDCLSWLYGQGFPKSLNLPGGRGTALKPSWEPIILARKPVQGTVAQNVEKHGTGAINIDACRVGSETIVSSGWTGMDARRFREGTRPEDYSTRQDPSAHAGRWPANVLLDEEAAAMLDEQTGDVGGGFGTRGSGPLDGRIAYALPEQGQIVGFGDSGGASRFYYVAKPSREERDYGCHAEARRSAGECTGRADGSAGLASPRAGASRTSGARNFHPTVKPVELMRWLVNLVTPIGGIVLDPFTGSGTTGMACRYEQRRFVGIEREAEYVEIAKARIAAVAPLFAHSTPSDPDIRATAQAVLFP
jgi:site-specific DNA-methyltransferase (adenine-specific)